MSVFLRFAFDGIRVALFEPLAKGVHPALTNSSLVAAGRTHSLSHCRRQRQRRLRAVIECREVGLSTDSIAVKISNDNARKKILLATWSPPSGEIQIRIQTILVTQAKPATSVLAQRVQRILLGRTHQKPWGVAWGLKLLQTFVLRGASSFQEAKMLRTTMWPFLSCAVIAAAAAASSSSQLPPCPRYACVTSIFCICVCIRAPLGDLQGHVVYASNFYRLDHLTRVINFTGRLDPCELLCKAHAASVKLLSNAPYPAGALHNADVPLLFAAQVDATRAGFSDGINFDFEDPLSAAGAPYGRNALAFPVATGVVRQSRGERSAMQIDSRICTALRKRHEISQHCKKQDDTCHPSHCNTLHCPAPPVRRREPP